MSTVAKAFSLEWEEEDEDGKVEVRRSEVAPTEAMETYIDDKPDWLGPQPDGTVATGTMFLLLGNTGQENTFLGPEGAFKTYEAEVYLNRRMFNIPDGRDLRVEVPQSTKSEQWISFRRDRLEGTAADDDVEGSAEATTNRVLNSPIRGGHNLGKTYRATDGHTYSWQTIRGDDGTKIHWLFAETSEPHTGTGRAQRFLPQIAALYAGELHHPRHDAQIYRRFGISVDSVRKRTWIVVEPRKAADETDKDGGVFPTSSRTSLRYVAPVDAKGNRASGTELPRGIGQTCSLTTCRR